MKEDELVSVVIPTYNFWRPFKGVRATFLPTQSEAESRSGRS